MHPNIQKRERSSSSRKSSFSSSSLSSSVFSTQKTSSNVSIGTAIHSASRLAVTSTPAAKFKASSSSSISSKNTITTNQVETSVSTKRNCLVLANDLLKMCFEMGKSKYMREITSIKQIDSQLFLFIVESILEEELAGKRNDEIHNLQLVIDSISSILKEDMQHIEAEIIMKRSKQDFKSLEYLLSILKELAEWINERAQSRISTSRSSNRSSRKSETSGSMLKVGRFEESNATISYRQSRSIERSRDNGSRTIRSQSSNSSWSSVSSLSLSSTRKRDSSEVVKAKRKMLEIVERQTKQVELLRKELEEARRLEQIKEERRMKMASRAEDREKKMETVRQRRFEEQLKLEKRSSDLKKSTNSVKLRRSLSREIVEQERKNHIEVKRYYEDRFKEVVCHQNDRIESMDNFYRDRIEILKETMQNERDDYEIREKANIEYLEKFRRECEAKLSMDLIKFKEAIFKSSADFFFY